MKHIVRNILIAMLGLITITSCKELTLSETNLVLDGRDGSSASVTITTKESWKIEIDSSVAWIHVSRNGGNGTGDITISADCNYEYGKGTRYGAVIVKTASNFYTIEVAQELVVENGDLGLSVEWNTKNVGASTSTDYGNYYTFEEAKRINESDWRCPTEEEYKELLQNCKSYWLSKDGVYGRVFISKINSNAIFLPAAGYRGSDVNGVGSNGDYWSSSNAYYLYFHSDAVNVFSPYFRDDCYLGRSVRLVRDL